MKYVHKAVFLDRDGTINKDKNYLYKADLFEFLPGVFEGLRKLEQAGYLLIIVTNQSGIARGCYTEEDFNSLNRWMLNQLEKEGIHISQVYYCPHLPDARIAEYRKECECRKPKPGMFLRAMEEWKINPADSWAIGDRLRDCSICGITACHGILIGQTETDAVIDAVKLGNVPKVQYAADLSAAAELIIMPQKTA